MPFCTPSRPESTTNSGSVSSRNVSVCFHLLTASNHVVPDLVDKYLSAGAKFGSKHAECIFISGPNPSFLSQKIASTRTLAASQGRNPSDLKFFISFTPILAATDAEAREKFNEHMKYSILEGSLAKFCGISGIDLSKWDLDEEFPTDENHISYQNLTPKQREVLVHRPDGYKSWTPRALGEYSAVGGSSPFCVGSGETVADEMEPLRAGSQQ